MSSFQFQVIGTVESPYKQKFAIPRQPGLIAEARGKLVLVPPYAEDDIVRGIEAFSHLWLVFVFHETASKGWSRATFRPNPIGLSVVKLERVYRHKSNLVLELSGIDLLDGTPILDIKPYLPYADALPEAGGGFADSAPQTSMAVSFSQQASTFCQAQTLYPELAVLIEKVLKQDPRPSYKKQRDAEQHYGMTLYHFNIKWTVNGDHNHVTEIAQLP